MGQELSSNGILLVDDDDTFGEELSGYLNAHGFTVDLAKSMDDAFERISAKQPSIGASREPASSALGSRYGPGLTLAGIYRQVTATRPVCSGLLIDHSNQACALARFQISLAVLYIS